MENASKALIIAGAILLSILIIALGIYVFNMAKNASSTSSLDELEVSQFNQTFTNYRGKLMGSGVVDLLDKVVANASANKESDERLPDIIYLDTRASGTAVAANTAKNWNTIAASSNAANAYAAEGFSGTYGSAFIIESDSTTPNINNIGALRSKMAEKHYYQVGFHNDDETGLIQYIIIQY